MFTSADRPSTSGPKLLDRLADALHQHKYAPALVHAYVEWVRRYIYFHHLPHPAPTWDFGFRISDFGLKANATKT